METARVHSGRNRQNPPGLDAYLEGQKAKTNQQAQVVVGSIERMLQNTIVEELKRECGADEQEWWMTGVPTNVRMKASERYEEDGGKRGGRELYPARARCGSGSRVSVE